MPRYGSCPVKDFGQAIFSRHSQVDRVVTNYSCPPVSLRRCPSGGFSIQDRSTKKYDAYAIDTIKLNSTVFPTSTFVLHSDTKLVGFDGFIGLSVFKGYYVEVSFTKNTISLYKEKPKGYSKYIQVLFDKQSCPYVQIAIDGITSPFLFDTGNPLNIVFPLPIASSIDRKKYQKIISLDKDYESYRVNIGSYDDGFRVYKNITGD